MNAAIKFNPIVTTATFHNAVEAFRNTLEAGEYSLKINHNATIILTGTNKEVTVYLFLNGKFIKEDDLFNAPYQVETVESEDVQTYTDGELAAYFDPESLPNYITEDNLTIYSEAEIISLCTRLNELNDRINININQSTEELIRAITSNNVTFTEVVHARN